MFEYTSKKMQIDFEMIRNAMEHRGAKGTSFEEVVRLFLEEYFPKSLDLSTGFIVDSDGRESKQIDIIVSDSSKTPIFYEKGALRVVPVECVYSVIEVKSLLDSTRLRECFENMASIRRLKKKAYSKDPPYGTFSVNQYDRIWPMWDNPVNYYVFAIDSIDLNTVLSTMEERFAAENAPPHSRIDTICVQEKGVICNRHKDGLDALPGLGSQLTCIPASLRPPLLLFYSLIGIQFHSIPSLELHEYIAKLFE